MIDTIVTAVISVFYTNFYSLLKFKWYKDFYYTRDRLCRDNGKSTFEIESYRYNIHKFLYDIDKIADNYGKIKDEYKNSYFNLLIFFFILVVIFMYFKIYIPSILFIIYVADVISIILTILSSISLAVLLGFYSYAACSDPGIVYKDAYMNDPEESISSVKVGMIECSQCQMMRPCTAMHCYDCGVCVEEVILSFIYLFIHIHIYIYIYI